MLLSRIAEFLFNSIKLMGSFYGALPENVTIPVIFDLFSLESFLKGSIYV